MIREQTTECWYLHRAQCGMTRCTRTKQLRRPRRRVDAVLPIPVESDLHLHDRPAHHLLPTRHTLEPQRLVHRSAIVGSLEVDCFSTRIRLVHPFLQKSSPNPSPLILFQNPQRSNIPTIPISAPFPSTRSRNSPMRSPTHHFRAISTPSKHLRPLLLDHSFPRLLILLRLPLPSTDPLWPIPKLDVPYW